MADDSPHLPAAADRIRTPNGRATVVKLGGSAMEVPAATAGMLDAVAALHRHGATLVLVHGGGKPIDRAMAAAGLTPLKIQGLRYTDDTTLEIVVRVLHAINGDLVRRLNELGVNATGVTGGVFGTRLMLPGVDLQPIDLGRVGKVTRVDAAQFHLNIGRSVVSVVPSLAVDDADGGWLNVNADAVAAGLAHELGGASVLFLTDTPGVLADRRDPATRSARLTVDECRAMLASGAIDGGMIPKVEACFEALEAGAGRAVILDGRDPRSLLDDFTKPGSTGTEIVK